MSTQDLTTQDSKPVPATMPFSTEVLREEMLVQAGFDRTRRIATLQKVIDTAVEDLEAESDTVITYLGQITAIHKQKNYVARAKAREQLIELIGVPSTKAASETKGYTPHLTIPLPNWAKVSVEANTPQVVVDKVE